jgi:hypothetical protein
VVRALGQDHLLAVQAGRTDLIASAPSPEDDEDEGVRADKDLLPFLRLGGRGGLPDDAGPLLQRKAETEERGAAEPRPRFGAELMRMVGERNAADEVSLSASSGGSATAPSEAVAGLLRLREKLGR